MLSKEFVELNLSIKRAGNILRQYFGKQLKLTYKSKTTSSDYQTRADIETEEAIISAIEKFFPGYNIIAEEHGKIQKGSEYTFVIDPLDGTNNFVLGIPVFASAVALMKDGEIVYGVIYDPIANNIYYALKGKGAFLNDEPINVNSEQNIKNATVGHFINYEASKQRVMDIRKKLWDLDVRRTLDIWAPAICYCKLASGKIEAIINDGINLYDFAAGKIIALEAGAMITDFAGNLINADAADNFLISNGTAIHSILVDKVTAV